MSTIPILSELEQYVRLTSKRETVIASNMANIDTPGYRTQDFDFQTELHRAMTSDAAGTPASSAPISVRGVKGLLERPDGNNVDLDRESMNLSETQLQYQLGTQLLKSRFHQLLSAINGGGQ